MNNKYWKMAKKMTGFPLFAAALVALALVFLMSCEKADNNITAANASTLKLYLTDGPADYQAVWIDIQKVMVHLSGDTTVESGWQEIPIATRGLLNLAQLRNGADTLLAEAEVPAGDISDIRLMLGNRNAVVLDNGDSVALLIPSGDDKQINLEVNNAALQPGVPFELVLDFDLAHSLHVPARSDSGNYMLTPNIRVFAKGAGASIRGWVLPDSAHAHVLAVSPFNDTITTIPDAPGGFFKLWGIPQGTYTLYIVPDSATGYAADTLLDIAAVQGKMATTDTIRLEKK